MEQQVQVYNMDFENCLEKIKNEQFDIIYLDPPYDTNYILKSLKKIIELKIAKEESLFIIETDDEQRVENEIKDLDIKIVDKRKYGRATIIFISLKKDA
jgi:16S rRNA G966 N2-methylase RsmD